jgi:hypothetical protein
MSQPLSPRPDVARTDLLEVVPGFAKEKLEGWIPELAGEEEVRQALEKAFDYRGDVTITRKDGSKVEGYIFDRRSGKTLSDSMVRLYPKDSGEKLAIPWSGFIRKIPVKSLRFLMPT